MIRNLMFAAAITAAAASTHATEYITSGTFSLQYTTSQPGWTVTKQSYGGASNVYFADYAAHVLSSGYKTTLSQEISGAAGALTLSFDLITDVLGPGFTQSVLFDGVSLLDVHTSIPFAVHYTFDVIGTGADTLQFVTDATGRNGNATIRNVSLVTRAVPEPATWGMMAGGLALFGFIARRQRRRQA